MRHSCMRRRCLAKSLVAWSFASRAASPGEDPTMRVVGVVPDQTLLHLVPTVKALTDNATVRNRVFRGPDFGTAAIRPRADV